MARGDRVKERVLGRIAASGHTVTVHYPAPRATIEGSNPGSAPASPLTGAPRTHKIIQPSVAPSKRPVTVKCLWYDVTGGVPSALRRDGATADQVGWVVGAEAVARVAVADAALDEDVPGGDTIFDDCQYVDHLGQRYTVLSCKPVGTSFAAPYSYYVWLQGYKKQ